MQIYLVRHGQTRENLASRHQPEDTPLTAEGKRQAKEVSEKLKALSPTHLITSNLVRAIQTAQIIGEECALVPDTNHHFVELIRPNHMYGRHHGSLASVWYYLWWALGKDTVKKDGSESYATLRKRIKAAQISLAKLPADARVIVVSHSVFISLFVAHLCRDKSLSIRQGIKVFRRMLSMPNANIIPLTFEDKTEANTCNWSIQN